MIFDKFMHPNFEPYDVHCTDVNNPSDDEIPYDFEQVYNIVSKEYEYNKDNCCYYSPVIDVNSYKPVLFSDKVLKVTRDKVYAKGVGVSEIKFMKGDVEIVLEVKVFHNHKLPVALTKPKPNKKDFKVYLFKGGVFSVKDILRHGMCRHYHKCIFRDKKLWENFTGDVGVLKSRIKEVMRLMEEYNYLLECYNNGEVLFREEFEDYYDIRFVDGRVVVSVDGAFRGVVNRSINMLKMELRDLNRELFRLERR